MEEIPQKLNNIYQLLQTLLFIGIGVFFLALWEAAKDNGGHISIIKTFAIATVLCSGAIQTVMQGA